MKCPHCHVSKEAFADDASWISHVQHCIAEQRRERLAALPKPKVQTPPRIAALLRRMRDREYAREYYREHRDAINARRSESRKRDRKLRPEHYRAIHRRSYWRNVVTERLRSLAYYYDHREARQKWYQDHREEQMRRVREWRQRNLDKYREHDRKQSREYWRAHREELLAKDQARRMAMNPNYQSQEMRSRIAHERQDTIIALRLEGWSWPEIAELTGWGQVACEDICRKARKHLSAEQRKQLAAVAAAERRKQITANIAGLRLRQAQAAQATQDRILRILQDASKAGAKAMPSGSAIARELNTSHTRICVHLHRMRAAGLIDEHNRPIAQ